MNVTEKDTQMLDKLATFLKNDMIQQLVQDMYQPDMVKISDNKSISETMHQYGINVRYLGYMAS